MQLRDSKLRHDRHVGQAVWLLPLPWLFLEMETESQRKTQPQLAICQGDLSLRVSSKEERVLKLGMWIHTLGMNSWPPMTTPWSVPHLFGWLSFGLC